MKHLPKNSEDTIWNNGMGSIYQIFGGGNETVLLILTVVIFLVCNDGCKNQLKIRNMVRC